MRESIYFENGSSIYRLWRRLWCWNQRWSPFKFRCLLFFLIILSLNRTPAFQEMDLGRFFKPQKQDLDHTHKETPPNKPCAIPMLNQVMSATSGATDVVSRHVNSSLSKLGAKNIEAGIACGVGLPVKPGLLHQVQYFLVVTTTKMMMKFGIAPKLPFGQGAFPASFQSGIDMANTASRQLSTGSIKQLATKPDQVFQGLFGSQPEQVGSASENTALKSEAVDSTSGSRTEKVLSFLRNPLSKGKPRGLDEADERMRSENNIVQMVLKHQDIIEELVEDNEKLRRILVEDLKVPSSKLKANSSGKSKLACTDCPGCGRKQRKK